MQNIVLEVSTVLVVVLLFKGTEGLDAGKDNSTGVGDFSHDNSDFGEDGDFVFSDSSEQL